MTTQNTKNINLDTLDNIVLPRLKACRNRDELNNFLTSAVDEALIHENPYFLIQLWELQVGILKEGQRVPFSRRPADVVRLENVMKEVRASALCWKETIYQRNSKHPLKVADLMKLENITYGNGKALNSDESGATGMVLVTAIASDNLAHYVNGKNVATGEEVRFEVKWDGFDGDFVARAVSGVAGGFGGLRSYWKPTLLAA